MQSGTTSAKESIKSRTREAVKNLSKRKSEDMMGSGYITPAKRRKTAQSKTKRATKQTADKKKKPKNILKKKPQKAKKNTATAKCVKKVVKLAARRPDFFSL